MVCVGLAIGVSFGLSSAFGVFYSPIHSTLPFLLLGKNDVQGQMKKHVLCFPLIIIVQHEFVTENCSVTYVMFITSTYESLY